MKKTDRNNRTIFFRRWSRKGYAVFNSLKGQVVISTLAAAVSSVFTPKKSGDGGVSFILGLERRIVEGGEIDPDEALELAAVTDREALYSAANRIREYYRGQAFDLCSIVNARSGRCSEDCKWCSQSVHHSTNIEIYELVESREAIAQAKRNCGAGVKKFSLVTSGRTISSKNLESLCDIYDKIGGETSLELCASMGLLTEDKLQRLYSAGVRNYHCNIESAPSFFPSLCSTHTTQEKIETLKAARRVGMKLCSGGIIGMGESVGQRIEMAFALKDIGVDSIPLNILNPIKGTPLESTPPLSGDDILTAIALFRFINPRAIIRFAGGRTTMLHLQERALKAGINGAIVGDMLTTDGISMEEDIENIRKTGFIC